MFGKRVLGKVVLPPFHTLTVYVVGDLRGGKGNYRMPNQGRALT